MADDSEDRGKRQGKRKIGFRSPPMEHCFPPGTSGNPRGRPKGSKNKPVRVDGQRAGDMIIEEAFRNVKLRENGAVVEMPLYRVAMRKMSLQAASGNTRAAKCLHYAVTDTLRRREAANDSYRDMVADYIVNANAAIAERMAKTLPIDDIVPHPDDILWDADTAMPYIVDPATLPSLEENRARLVAVNTVLEWHEKLMAEASSEEERAELRAKLPMLLEYRRILEHAIKRQEYQQAHKKRAGKS